MACPSRRARRSSGQFHAQSGRQAGSGPGWQAEGSAPPPALPPALPYTLAWGSSGQNSWHWGHESPAPPFPHTAHPALWRHRRQIQAGNHSGQRRRGSPREAAPDAVAEWKNIRRYGQSACSQAGGESRSQSQIPLLMGLYALRMRLIFRKESPQARGACAPSKNSQKKWGGIAAARNLWREEGDLLGCLLRLLCVLLHAFLPALLAFLHELLRLLPLLRSEHGIDLRPGTLLLHNQVSGELSLFAGEGAGFGLIEGSVDICVLRLFILTELLHQGFDPGLSIGHDAFDLGLLGLSQVQLPGHAFQHPTTMAAKTPAGTLC